MSDDEIKDPLFIKDLIGHYDAWNEVSDAWESGRFAHAWLITGPRGIGKASFAYSLTKAIFCSAANAGGMFDASGASGLDRKLDLNNPIVRRVESGAHPDMLKIQIGWTDEKQVKKRTEIVVDDVRALGGFLSKTAAEGGWRVVVVDAVDEMNRNAANALLKNLEEPPKNTVLFLVAHNPGRLLPTIRSRCRRLTLAPLTESEMLQGVSRLMPDLAPHRQEAMLKIAQGSLGKTVALARLDGDTLAAEIDGLLKFWPKLDIAAVSKFATKVASDPERFHMFSALLGDWLSQTMKQCAGVPCDGHANASVQAVPLEQWFEVWEKISDLFRKTDAVNLDRRHVTLSVFHTLVSPAAA